MLLFIVAVVFGALSLAHVPFPMDPNATNLERKLLAPNAVNWLGTDNLGRDVFTRMLHGAYISLTVGFVAVAVSLVIGVVVGAISGYSRRLGRQRPDANRGCHHVLPRISSSFSRRWRCWGRAC